MLKSHTLHEFLVQSWYRYRISFHVNITKGKEQSKNINKEEYTLIMKVLNGFWWTCGLWAFEVRSQNSAIL